MTERLTHRTVVFVHHFALAGTENVHPPGSYDVETIEEPIEGVSMLAWRRVSTSITLPAPHLSASARQATTIDPAALAAALSKDAETSHGPPKV